MVRQVRGLGTLTPEDIRWIPATTQGRVEKIILRPGTQVKSGDVILELSNPQLEQQLQDAAAEARRRRSAASRTSGCSCNNDLLAQRATSASIEADYNKAKMQAQMNEALAKDQLVSNLVLQQSQVDAESLGVRNQISKDQLASKADSMRAQMDVQQSLVDQARALLALDAAAARRAEGARRPRRHAAAGAGGSRPAGRAGHQPRARREPEPAEGGDQDRGDAGQGHPDRPEGRGRHAQRHRRRARRAHRSVGAERHAHGGRHARRRAAEGRACPT